jgi:hypothetical protein
MRTDTTLTRAAAEYLDAVRAGMADLDDDDRDAIIRELEARLRELGEQNPSEALGEPETFVAEFRRSAGLDAPFRRGRMGRLAAVGRDRISKIRRLAAIGRDGIQRLSEHPMSAPFHRHRSELRTVWVWTRGWILLSAVSWLDGPWFGGVFTFGVPQSDTSTGLLLVGAATAGSLWLAGRRNDRRWDGVDRIVTAATVLFVGVAWLNPVHFASPYDDAGLYPFGHFLTNIYAYDRSGQPVDVLLYDQDGQPIYLPGFDNLSNGPEGGEVDVFADQWGPLRLETDRYGQPVTNLYPLQRLTEYWNGASGRPEYEPVAPPRVGIPEFPQQTDEQGESGEQNSGDAQADSESPITTTSLR